VFRKRNPPRRMGNVGEQVNCCKNRLRRRISSRECSASDIKVNDNISKQSIDHQRRCSESNGLAYLPGVWSEASPARILGGDRSVVASAVGRRTVRARSSDSAPTGLRHSPDGAPWWRYVRLGAATVTVFLPMAPDSSWPRPHPDSILSKVSAPSFPSALNAKKLGLPSRHQGTPPLKTSR